MSLVEFACPRCERSQSALAGAQPMHECPKNNNKITVFKPSAVEPAKETEPMAPQTTKNQISKGAAPRAAAKQKAKVAESKQKLDDLKARQEAGPRPRFTVAGKAVPDVHNRLSGISRATSMKGGVRISTDALRALMVAAGIADPDHGIGWAFELPNGVTIATVLDSGPIAATRERKAKAAPKAKAPKTTPAALEVEARAS